MDQNSDEPVDVAALFFGGKEVDWVVCHLSPADLDHYIIDLVVTGVPASGETDTALGLFYSAFESERGVYTSTPVRMALGDVPSRVQLGEGKRMTWAELKEAAKQKRDAQELKESAEKLKEAGAKLQATGEELKIKGAELRASGVKKMKGGSKTSVIVLSILGVLGVFIAICCLGFVYFYYIGDKLIPH